MKRMLVIDGNSIMFRAYFATAAMGNLMQTRSGLYTNALYGFVNMMEHIKKNIEYDYLFVAFDKGKKTFRHQAYADYKGGRKKTPDELLMQISYIKDYLDVIGVKHLELDDYEADDIVGSMAYKFKDQFDEVMVVSGDKDLLQLVHGNVHVYLTIKGLTDLRCHTEENFHELMGIESSQMTDYKGLLGDNSDNLPGIPGVGTKTACKLLEQYHSLEGIIENMNDIPGKLGENVRNNIEIAKTSKYLATIITNVPLDYSLDELIKVEPNIKELRSFYEKFEFKSFIKKLPTSNEMGSNNEEIITDNTDKIVANLNLNYHLNDADALISALQGATSAFIEVELDGENYHKANLLGLSVTIGNDNYYLEEFYLHDWILKASLEKESINYYAVDSKKVYVALSHYDINIKNFVFDLILASYVIDPASTAGDIKSIVDTYVDNKLCYLTDVYGKKTKYVVPDVTILEQYSGIKTGLLPIVKQEIDKKLKSNQQLSLYYDIELPLAKVLADMEIAGFKVDIKRLDEISELLLKQMASLEKEIYELVGFEFNISSPKQLGEVLFDHLALAKGKKNQSGYSTNAEVLEKLSAIHPVPKLVLEYRKYAKLYSTYCAGLKEEVNSDGKVRTIFKQALTLTGRLSSVEPNIQNIPVKTEDGRLIRSAFVPSFDGGMLVSADYSQIELRVLAGLAKCEKMIEFFNQGVDLHSSTAALIFGVNPSMVTKELRRMAKAVNFGIVYGMSAWGLSEEVHVSPAEAADFINRYFQTFPEIKTYMDDVLDFTKEFGYTLTIFNRRRYIPMINESNAVVRQLGERTAKNAPIQGSAADIIKVAMLKVAKKLQDENMKSKLIVQVHDELVIDAHPDEIEKVKLILKDTMENVMEFNVPFEVEVCSGYNWDMK